MNFYLWILILSTNQKDFTSSVFIGWSRVHLDMTSCQVLSDVRGNITYHHSWLLLLYISYLPWDITKSGVIDIKGIFWPLCCLSFIDLQILITLLVSFGHCVVCPSLIYRFWLPFWYLLAIVLSVLHWFTDSVYLFGVFKLFLYINLSNDFILVCILCKNQVFVDARKEERDMKWFP